MCRKKGVIGYETGGWFPLRVHGGGVSAVCPGRPQSNADENRPDNSPRLCVFAGGVFPLFNRGLRSSFFGGK
jgi:hypothetical protein